MNCPIYNKFVSILFGLIYWERIYVRKLHSWNDNGGNVFSESIKGFENNNYYGKTNPPSCILLDMQIYNDDKVAQTSVCLYFPYWNLWFGFYYLEKPDFTYLEEGQIPKVYIFNPIWNPSLVLKGDKPFIIMILSLPKREIMLYDSTTALISLKTSINIYNV